jgi:hypothetical protein
MAPIHLPDMKYTGRFYLLACQVGQMLKLSETGIKVSRKSSHYACIPPVNALMILSLSQSSRWDFSGWT